MVRPKIHPLGESAVIVEFGSVISDEINESVIAFTDYLNSHPFPGLIEAVPAYASAAVYYDLAGVLSNSRSGITAYEIVSDQVAGALHDAPDNEPRTNTVIEIPTSFTPSCAIDLEAVATNCGLGKDDVIDIFISRTYRVFMLGFLPGFAYMGSVDERIGVPRRREPRTRVPRGSVGIAGEQCGVYPFETPGGWNIIGHTEVEFFRPYDDRPSLLKAGDHVRFVAA
jgi:inhibitor of KinA